MSSRGVAISVAINDSLDNADPEWTRWYINLGRILLSKQLYVAGEDFKVFAMRRGLWKPKQHNHWVGAPLNLERLKLMEAVVMIKPAKNHNHMPAVTLWRSKIFDEKNLYPKLGENHGMDEYIQK
jgi:hypothetical protein